MGMLCAAYAHRIRHREIGGAITMDIIVAIVLLAGAALITYLALDAARHVK
jgi:hypothetical protein